MGAITTQAVVLRNADYRENDRMLTLLTPGYGRVDALARGCKRPNSPLLPGSELFAFGEYVLFQGKGRAMVTSCTLTDSFYSLREDYEKLRYAVYLLQVSGAQAQPAERAADLFTLLLRSLTRLCYTDLDARAVTTAFLLLDAALAGYRPRLSHCVRCGNAVAENEARLFDIEEGGLVCRDCASALLPALPIRAPEILWMRDVLKVGIEKTTRPALDAPLPLMIKYMETRLETRFQSGKGLR